MLLMSAGHSTPVLAASFFKPTYVFQINSTNTITFMLLTLIVFYNDILDCDILGSYL